jgi:hypothetical protein
MCGLDTGMIFTVMIKGNCNFNGYLLDAKVIHDLMLSYHPLSAVDEEPEPQAATSTEQPGSIEAMNRRLRILFGNGEIPPRTDRVLVIKAIRDVDSWIDSNVERDNKIIAVVWKEKLLMMQCNQDLLPSNLAVTSNQQGLDYHHILTPTITPYTIGPVIKSSQVFHIIAS